MCLFSTRHTPVALSARDKSQGGSKQEKKTTDGKRTCEGEERRRMSVDEEAEVQGTKRVEEDR